MPARRDARREPAEGGRAHHEHGRVSAKGEGGQHRNQMLGSHEGEERLRVETDSEGVQIGRVCV